MSKRWTACVRFLLPALGLVVAALPLHAAPRTSGIDRAGFDASARPQDDFNRYVNGHWIDTTEIPADKTTWGSFVILREESDKHQREIIEGLSQGKPQKKGTEAQQIGDLYASLMDQGKANALQATPLLAYLARIDRINDMTDLARAWAELARAGVAGPIAPFVNVDSRDSGKYALYLSQAGLGLPNRNYYLKEGEKNEEIRRRYPEYIARMFELAGVSDGATRARAVYDLEMKLAGVQWTPEDSRDATKTNNVYKLADLGRVSDKFAWPAFLDGAGMAGRQDLFVRQPTYVTALGDLLQQVPLDDWKNYLRFHVIDDAAPWMSDDFATAHFEFFDKLIGGQQEEQQRWQRSVQAVNGTLGEAVGKIYVQRYFPPAAKKRMNEMVQNILQAFQVSIDNLDWMSPATKTKAQEKRARFTTKIGYPDKWKDYTGLDIRRDDALGNLERAARWEYDRRLARIDKPVDRGEWGMTPQTVNAYNNSRLNEIVFPAAILQPPFFNLEADDAVNYGGIGAVIGHEIGHAFDDQGRKTDGNGNLNDWWTEADAAAFTAKAQKLVEQYNGFKPLPDLNANGQLTLGENIGDLTGLSIAYLAYTTSLHGKEAPVIDGLSGDQRFFYGYAQIWRSKSRDEAMRRLVLTNPHSPPQFRVIGPLRNFGPFYDFFGVKEGDGMYLPPAERVEIW
jgi:putative endopeptidase